MRFHCVFTLCPLSPGHHRWNSSDHSVEEQERQETGWYLIYAYLYSVIIMINITVGEPVLTADPGLPVAFLKRLKPGPANNQDLKRT